MRKTDFRSILATSKLIGVLFCALAALFGLSVALTTAVAGPSSPVAGPDFSTSVKMAPRSIHPGDRLTYTIVAVNTGSPITGGVVLSDPLPGGVTFITGSCRSTITGGPASVITCTGTPPRLWQQEVFSSGERVTTTFAVTVAKPGTLYYRLVNHAYLVWDGGQQEMTATTTIVPAIPDFSHSSKAGPLEAERGDVITYTIVAVNSGETISSVVLSDPAPTGLEFARCRYVVAGGESGECGGDSGDPSRLWSHAVLSGEPITTTVAFTVTSSTLRWPVTNCATLRSGNVTWQKMCAAETLLNPKAYIYLPVVLRGYPPVWRQAGGTAGVNFYDISVCPGNHLIQYAGTADKGVYRSEDGGKTWQHWALAGRATPVIANPNTYNCNEAFAAVWGDGVHRITGQNQTTPINEGLGELYLYGLVLDQDGTTLYLYAGSSGNGVYRTSIDTIDTINWEAISTGIGDQRIRSLYVIDGDLYAGGRQCTYYHSTDGDSWQAESVISGGTAGACGDAQVWAIAQMGGDLYAGLQGKGLYRKDGNWVAVADVPQTTIYRFGLLNHGSYLYVSAFGDAIYRCDTSGCEQFPYGGLGTNEVRGLAVVEEPSPRLEVASSDGIWWIQLVP